MVEIVQYETKWSLLYKLEKEKLYSTLKDFSLEIEHIGSTAVPQLAATPIVDVMIGVSRKEDMKEVIKILQNESHIYVEETGVFILLKESVPTHHYPHRMTKKQEQLHVPINVRRAHIYVTVLHSSYWDERISFRDYLRKNAMSKNQYAKVKKELSSKFWNDIEKYTHKKEVYIEQFLKGVRLQMIGSMYG
ncbi:GrpB family protein [Priestia megaterium]|nr:GrpB family protein [Priestia megaterium]